MNAIGAIREYFTEWVAAWNRFWFEPADPAVLSLIRIFAGAMLFYTHLVWSFDLQAFFGGDGWLPLELMERAQGPQRYGTMWSYFKLEMIANSPVLLWTVHLTALIVFACLTLGIFSRTMSVLAYLAAVSYVNRISPGAFFGLDKVNCMLAMYLMLGPCGARFSLDRWWKLKRAEEAVPDAAPSVGANVAIRLIQLHMCIIYLFSGLGKLQGWSWWDGSALWMSFANLEYQSFDMTWLARFPRFVGLITHLTVFWELFYIVLVWHRMWRPIILISAIIVHTGIALSMGMITFGLAMLIGNAAFLTSALVRGVIEPLADRLKPTQT